LSITQLTQGEGVTRQAITKHLDVLAEVGLARGTRQGRETLWALEPRRLEIAQRWLLLVSQRWDEALGRLRQSVEEG
jgi:DNA-binding transcriptional ArsR family regulator